MMTVPCDGGCGKAISRRKTTIRKFQRDSRPIRCRDCARVHRKLSVYHNRSLEDRYWEYVDKSPGQGPNGDCWGWKGSTSHGYGQLGRYAAKHGTSTPIRAHVISYQIHYGELPEGHGAVLHRCDNPPCSNPAHLFSGTDAINIRDAVAKGRFYKRATQWAEQARIAKIILPYISSPSQKRIFAAYYAGEQRRSLREVARGLEISYERVRQIVSAYPLDRNYFV